MFLIFYTYFGYPLLLSLIAGRARGRRQEAATETGGEAPRVALLIAARNEEKVIAAKIENSLSQDYPSGRLDIVIVSDGSSDRTDEITESYAGRGVRLMRIEGGMGKTVARNIAVSESDADIIVFSDSNAIYRPDAVSKLVAHFADPAVGAVCGNLRLEDEYGRENTYWKYEKWIKMLEDRTHSIIGANGSIYAIRRELYRPLDPSEDDDFIEPLLCYMDGFELRYEPGSVSIEKDIPAGRMIDEFRAKKRVVQRGIQSLASVKRLLNPLRFPYMSFALFSHKLLKWTMPFVMLALFIDNIALIHSHFFELTLSLQVLFLLSALAGLVTRRGPLRIPAYFVVTNAAVLSAVIAFLSGRRNTAWQVER